MLYRKMFKWLLLLLLLPAALACPTDTEFRLTLKAGLYSYMQSPAGSAVSLSEMQDLLVFYLTKDIGASDCSTETGQSTGLTISHLLQKASASASGAVPKCTDGTVYGECSRDKPNFCYSGMLRPMCHGPDRTAETPDDCGCPQYQTCESDGTCRQYSIACYSDDNCGESTYAGQPYCLGNDVFRRYLRFYCENPGTPQAACSYEQQEQLVQSCEACLNGACV